MGYRLNLEMQHACSQCCCVWGMQVHGMESAGKGGTLGGDSAGSRGLSLHACQSKQDMGLEKPKISPQGAMQACSACPPLSCCRHAWQCTGRSLRRRSAAVLWCGLCGAAPETRSQGSSR